MKWLLSGILAIIAIVLIVGIVLYFTIDGMTRRGIERGTSYATGTPASLDSADLSVRRGELTLTDFEIGNPEGFTSPHFMQLGTGDVAVTLRSLLADEVEVPYLHLKGVDLNLERQDGRNNYDVILENLEKLQGPPEAQPDEDGKRYIIREVLITDVVVKAAMLPGGEEPRVLTVRLDDIRLTDVGSDTDSGVLLSQLSGTIMQAVMQAVVEQAGDVLPAAMAGELRARLAGLGELGGFDLETLSEGVGGIISDVTGQEATDDLVRDTSEMLSRTVDERLEEVTEETDRVLEDADRAVDDAAERAREGADRLREGMGDLLNRDRNGDGEDNQ